MSYYRHSIPPSIVSSNAPSRQISLDRLFATLNVEGERSKPPTRYCPMLMHHFKGNVGPGIFAIGEAFKHAGLYLGPPCLVLIGIIMVTCQHMLLEANTRVCLLHEYRAKPDYAETVFVGFLDGLERFQRYANRMKHLTNAFLIFTQMGFCCIYYVFIGSSINRILEYYYHPLDIHLIMAMIVVPLWLPTLITNLKYMAPLSLMANIFTWVGLSLTIYYCSQDIPPLSRLHPIGAPWDIPLFLGTCIFIFECIGLIIPMFNEMASPADFIGWFGVLNVGSFLIITCFVTTGLMSYIKYGEEIKSSTTLNLPIDDPLAQAVVILIALEIFVSYVIQMYVPVEILFPMIEKKYGPFKSTALAVVLFKTFLTLIAFTCAEVIPFLGLFISLVGGFGGGVLAVVIPPCLHMTLFYEEMNSFEYLRDILILIFGFFAVSIVTYVSVLDITKAFVDQFD